MDFKRTRKRKTHTNDSPKKKKKNPHKIFVLVWILESLNHRSTWIMFMGRGVLYVRIDA